MKILELKNISFGYEKGKPLFSKISTSIEKGDFIAVFWENGKGKTTLIKMILGLIKPTSGSISWIDEEKKYQNCPYRIEYISQKANNIDTIIPMTVEEVMELSLTPKKSFSDAVDCSYADIDTALKHVSMLEYKKKLFRDLSGGQQQRVLIAKALVSNPEILILDEPTAGIDIIAQRHLYTLLEHLNLHHHITILLISHDTQFLEREKVKVWYVGKMDCDECHNEKVHLFQIKKMFPKNTVEYLH